MFLFYFCDGEYFVQFAANIFYPAINLGEGRYVLISLGKEGWGEIVNILGTYVGEKMAFPNMLGRWCFKHVRQMVFQIC